ncbi:hypothetical protein GCK72_003076 [Caenorhabditis remanei]|uniref:Uncharacterized protein n=1 Tax=Caenorhabditis remanei TaxID=31234 RepID=A0A6A5HST0_CAERE|nr:hypothetical protein GCK72_003076 [Caenorhabditis remanei]KAF1771250.1 hypothetical protein GCK72_003076 [Caenorhabditis remanei]
MQRKATSKPMRAIMKKFIDFYGAITDVMLRNPYVINNLDRQYDLLDRRTNYSKFSQAMASSIHVMDM